MDLVPYIFHERQEAGSQLCAQHCLNNILQQPVYTEVDLADLARKLDEAEVASTYAAPPTKSYNYDDTGFFSISVLEKALQVWDLTLVRWRGEAMKPYVDNPEEQAGFILNLASHWFSLRRFGETTRWYNLNSFLPTAEWISPTYLKMVLTQAEAEGYSVFVIRKAGVGAGERAGDDPGEAAGWGDGGVGVLPESGADLMALQLGETHDRRGSGAFPAANVDDVENGEPGPSSAPPYSVTEPTPAAGSGRRRRRQEDLLSEFVEEQDLISSHPSSRARTPRPRGSGRQENRDIFDDDVAMLNEADHNDLMHYDHDDEELDEEDGDGPPVGRYSAMQQQYGGPTDFAFHSRSYDDEDSALQAALKASMEGLPDGFVMPELKPIEPPSIMRPAPPPPAPVAAEPEAEAESKSKHEEEDVDIVEDDDDDKPAKALSPEEIRAARLARFQ